MTLGLRVTLDNGIEQMHRMSPEWTEGGETMHMLVINFGLKDIDESQYCKMCESVAPAFAALPGLISKVWLADAATNTYGGIYTFKDRQAMDAYKRSDLFKSLTSSANLVNVSARDFTVIEAPTRTTRGLA
jgi:Putative mono-oxygenase ydhR